MDASTILHLLTTYHFFAIFIGAVILGETIILGAAFLAGQGVWSIYTVFVLTFLGTVLSDCVWFFLGKKMTLKSREWQEKQAKYRSLLAGLERLTRGRAFLSLLFIKFLYGTRIITIMYLAVHSMRFRTFLLFNGIGTLLWLLVLLPIGLFAGRQIGSDIPDIKKIQYTATFLLAFLVVTRLGVLWFKKRYVK